MLRQFVRVRVIQGNGLDLERFEFDYDLTFAAFFLNSDGTIYGRYGTRSSQKEATRDISLAGFAQALAGALELHASYPRDREHLAGKSRPRSSPHRTPESYPSLKKFSSTLTFGKGVARQCIHCHMIGNAERRLRRESAQEIPDEILFPWPHPNVVGLAFDPKEKARVSAVTADSPAARAGFRPGDRLRRLDGQPLISIADVQWVLHCAGSPASLDAVVTRGERAVELSLDLPPGWRRSGDLSWRTTSWDLRRMALGGMLLKPASSEERARAKVEPSQLALRVEHVGQYGEHRTAKDAGLRKGDILVEVDGRSDLVTESAIFAHAMQTRKRGDRLQVVVVRDAKRVKFDFPLR